MHRAMKKDKVQAETIAPVLYRQKEVTFFVSNILCKNFSCEGI